MYVYGCIGLRAQVPNNWASWILVLVIVVQVLGKVFDILGPLGPQGKVFI